MVDAPPRQPAASINATFAPVCAAPTAAATPAEPPPTTKTSYFRIISIPTEEKSDGPTIIACSEMVNSLFSKSSFLFYRKIGAWQKSPMRHYWRGANGHRDQFQDVSRSRAAWELFGGVTKDAYFAVGRDEPDRTARMEHAVVVVRTKYAQGLTDRPGTTSAARRSTHRS